jgi:hypothetical protein
MVNGLMPLKQLKQTLTTNSGESRFKSEIKKDFRVHNP